MARLRMIGPQVAPMVRRNAEVGQDRYRLRARALPWHPLYHTARWQRLRLVVLNRDRWVCAMTGTLLVGRYPAWNSAAVDHKVPAHEFWWDGRRDLFWDPDNLQALSKRAHDQLKQAEERGRQGVV